MIDMHNSNIQILNLLKKTVSSQYSNVENTVFGANLSQLNSSKSMVDRLRRTVSENNMPIKSSGQELNLVTKTRVKKTKAAPGFPGINDYDLSKREIPNSIKGEKEKVNDFVIDDLMSHLSRLNVSYKLNFDSNHQAVVIIINLEKNNISPSSINKIKNEYNFDLVDGQLKKMFK